MSRSRLVWAVDDLESTWWMEARAGVREYGHRKDIGGDPWRWACMQGGGSVQARCRDGVRPAPSSRYADAT